MLRLCVVRVVIVLAMFFGFEAFNICASLANTKQAMTGITSNARLAPTFPDMFNTRAQNGTSVTVTTKSGEYTYPPGVLIERPSHGVVEDSLTIHGKNYEVTWARRVIRKITVSDRSLSGARNLTFESLPYDRLLVPNFNSLTGAVYGPNNGCPPPVYVSPRMSRVVPDCGGGSPFDWLGDPSLYDSPDWGAPSKWYNANDGGGCFFNQACGNGAGTLLIVIPNATCDISFISGFTSCNWNLINWISGAYQPPAINLLQVGYHSNTMFYMQCKPITQTNALGAVNYDDPSAGFSTVGIAAYPANRYNSYSNPGSIFGLPGKIPPPTPPPAIITLTLQVYNNIIPLANNYIGWCRYSK